MTSSNVAVPPRASRTIALLGLILSFAGFLMQSLQGQVPNPTVPDNGLTPASPLGVPPYASSEGTSESVALMNGSVNLYIPLLSLPQHGGYPLSLGFVHHSNLNSFEQQTQVSGSIYNGAGASGGQGNDVIQDITYTDRLVQHDHPLEINLPRLQFSSEFYGDHAYKNGFGTIYAHTEVFCLTNFAFTDSSGNKHPFSNLTGCGSVNAPGTGLITVRNKTDSSDGSFYSLDTSNLSDIKVTAKNGTVYHFYGAR